MQQAQLLLRPSALGVPFIRRPGSKASNAIELSPDVCDDCWSGTTEATKEERPAVERIIPSRAMVRVGSVIVGWLLRSRLRRLVDEHLMLIRFRRRTYEVPMGRRNIEGRLGVLTSSPWRVNFRGGASVEVVLDGQLRSCHA